MAANPGLRQLNPIPFPGPAGDNVKGPIVFRHPAYPPRLSTFLRLPRVDPAGNNSSRGVHHRTALLACQIIANNAFGGQLFADRQGQHAVQLALEEVLTDDEYFFIIDRDPKLRYPVVPSFEDWRFPHGQVDFGPPHTPLSDQLNHRCVLTNHVSGIKTAHIVPKEEGDWFLREDMHMYFPDNASVNCPTNLMPLRADIHRCYDARTFVIVPKAERFGTNDGDFGERTYAVHVLTDSNHEFWGLYHNIPLQHIRHTCPEFHFARFAWAILIQVKPFLLQGHPRNVVRVGAGGEREVVELSGLALKELYGGGGSQSTSVLHPRKKHRTAGEDDEQDEEEEEWGIAADSDWQEERGRSTCQHELNLGLVSAPVFT